MVLKKLRIIIKSSELYEYQPEIFIFFGYIYINSDFLLDLTTKYEPEKKLK